MNQNPDAHGNCALHENLLINNNNNNNNHNNKKGKPLMLDIHETQVRYTSKQQMKTLVKLLFGALLILIATLVTFIVLYFGTYDSDVVSKHNSNVCLTKECVQISAKIIETMDHTKDPCDDFYLYSCGGWIKNNPIPDSRIKFSRYINLIERNAVALKQILNDLISRKLKPSTPALTKATSYYEACMNTKEIKRIGIQPVKDLIKKLGSWAVIDGSFNASNWDPMDALAKMHTVTALAPLFNLFVGGDIKNSIENVIIFDQSGIMMNRESYLQNSTYHKMNREAYKQLMRSLVKEMGANENGIALMEKVYLFEKELAKITKTELERRDNERMYKTMELKEFAKKTEIPGKQLEQFVNKIFSDTGKTVKMNERIVSYSTDYIRNAYKLFMNLTAEVQSSYLFWHAAKLMAPISLGKYEDIIDQYHNTAFGTKDREPRWEQCVRSTLAAFSNALARPFVKKVYDTTAKAMSTEMIKAIKGIFKDNLETMDWMDETTKAYAKKKAEKILENIGYPDYILNNTALEEEYKGFVVNKGEHFNNYMEQRRFRNLKNYKKRGTPVDKLEWVLSPTDVNAYYELTKNKIGFPAGILQWPYYDKRSPSYKKQIISENPNYAKSLKSRFVVAQAVAYGSIGMIVGHEITHGFDDQGKDFTIEGNLDTWWTNHSAAEFKKKTQCFIDQYSNFTYNGKKMKKGQTLGEDLADNGGLGQSLQAYRLWVAKNGEEKQLPGLDLTPEQLYFLSFAQVWCSNYRESAAIHQIENNVHSLSNLRVIGTLQNSKDFSEAYKCKSGSKMNPVNKCKIW